MTYAFIIAIMMSVGIYFMKEAMKILTGIESPYALIGLMFLWDGVVVFMTRPYASKEELAVGIMMGTLIKCLILIRHGKTSYIHPLGKTQGKEKGSSR